jgi:hypothetical protein
MHGHIGHRFSGATFCQPDGPRQPITRVQPRTVRAGTDDRSQVTELLQAHYVAGRLDATELEQRVERVLAAVTLADLDAVLDDLPPLPTAHAETYVPSATHVRLRRCPAAGPKSFFAHATAYVLVIAMLVAIWALTTPGGYFWPVWPMLGWGIGLASHGLAARSRQSSAVRLQYSGLHECRS